MEWNNIGSTIVDTRRLLCINRANSKSGSINGLEPLLWLDSLEKGIDRDRISESFQNVTVGEGQGGLFEGKRSLRCINTGFALDVLHFATCYILQRRGMQCEGVFPIVNHRREVLKYRGI